MDRNIGLDLLRKMQEQQSGNKEGIPSKNSTKATTPKANDDMGVMFIEAYGRKILSKCKVRNELNGLRKANEVIRTIGKENVPYMPRVFPPGKWRVYKPMVMTDPYLAPFFIPTDAWQYVDEWVLEKGVYVKPSGRKVKDSGYGLHFSTSNTTQGCIKIMTVTDLLWLVRQIEEELYEGLDPIIEVFPFGG